jgi:hypothetical protein
MEVSKLEERKKVRREIKEKEQLEKDKKERAEEEAETTQNTTTFAIGRGGRDDKSQTSSPFKAKMGGESPPRS